MKNNCIYFVEGQCEQKIVEALKEEPQRLRSGKIKLLNPITQEIPSSVLLTIKKGSVVVLIFDTDILITEQLKNNIRRIRKYCKVDIVYLGQVLNLEDELVRCTDISRIQELTNSKSKKDFKRDFCAMTNCRQVLDRHNLDVELMWNSKFPEKFEFLENNSNTVKTG